MKDERRQGWIRHHMTAADLAEWPSFPAEVWIGIGSYFRVYQVELEPPRAGFPGNVLFKSRDGYIIRRLPRVHPIIVRVYDPDCDKSANTQP
jgi:hypothetical protein